MHFVGIQSWEWTGRPVPTVDISCWPILCSHKWEQAETEIIRWDVANISSYTTVATVWCCLFWASGTVFGMVYVSVYQLWWFLSDVIVYFCLVQLSSIVTCLSQNENEYNMLSLLVWGSCSSFCYDVCLRVLLPIESMYGIFAYISHTDQLIVGKHIIHEFYGSYPFQN